MLLICDREDGRCPNCCRSWLPRIRARGELLTAAKRGCRFSGDTLSIACFTRSGDNAREVSGLFLTDDVALELCDLGEVGSISLDSAAPRISAAGEGLLRLCR